MYVVIKPIKIGKKLVGHGHPCYVIAEIGSNFDGSLSQAKKLIKLAKINANLHQLSNRIKFYKRDVDNFYNDKYDLIISNPPYIDKHQLKYLGVSEFEPCKALNGGVNGTEILRKVIIKASQLLKTNGNKDLKLVTQSV